MESVSIRLENITKIFMHKVKGEVTAVNNITLEVKQGELLTFLGPSGCGKTTTLRMIAGFEQPDAGTISIGNKDVTNLMANKRDIGFVFQNYALFPHLSIYENVAYGLKVRGVRGADIPDRVKEVLQLVNLERYQSQFPHQISGGEQQRVALARAIVIKPKVLLLDEPLSNLDAKLRINTRGEIRKLQKALGITAVYVTHDQEEAMAISDRIVVINNGNIIQIGTAEKLYYDPATMFVAKFIGRINSIPAIVKKILPHGVEISILGEKRTVKKVSKEVKINETVNALIRPEFIHLEKDTGGFNVTGVIRERTFLGEKVEYIVIINDVKVLVSSSDPGEHLQFSIDQKVGIQLNEEGIKILND